MFKRSQKKTSSKPQSYIRLVYTPKLLELLNINTPIPSDPIIPSDESFSKLLDYLTTITQDNEFRMKYSKELVTKDKRSKQLDETKKIVYSLRETDQTSDSALNFLKEKLDLLIVEREDLSMKVLSFLEKSATIPTYELEQFINSFLQSLTFLETESWEEDLDYYRTRFLMQREQDEKDDQLKQDFLPPEKLAQYDPLAKPKVQQTVTITKPIILLELTKKQSQKLSLLVKNYNQLVELVPDESINVILETPIGTLKEDFIKEEKLSFEIGKEMYALKREQGILTLKTYEIIQTIRSRLLNITGSIASRVFLKEGFASLATIVKNPDLTEEQIRLTLKKEINRLLRILGELKPGEEV
ncbi:MAG: hypothetical protein FK733_15225 [Asgard group archaeon]|nr:hypothetical protein [Asgard group archaeon]